MLEAAVADLDVTVPQQTPGQGWIALGVVAALAVIVTVLLIRTRFAGLGEFDDDRPKHKAALNRSLRRATARTLRLPISANFDAHREALAELWDQETPDPDQPRLRSAPREIHRSLATGLEPITGRVPRQALWLAELAVMLAILGALAVSTETLAEFIRHDPQYPSADLTLGWVADAAGGTASWAIGALGAFPFAGLLWALTLAYTIQAVQWVYQHYYITAPAVAAAAAAVYALERRVPEDVDQSLYHDRVGPALQVVAAFATIWLAGAIPAVAGSVVGRPSIFGVTLPVASAGAALGFLLALGLAAWGARYAVNRLRTRVRNAATLAWDDGPDRVALAYLVVRRVGSILGVVLAPFVPAYLAVIVLQGRLTTLGAAFLNASPDIQILTAVVAVLATGLVVWETRRAWPDLRAALTEAFSRSAVRSAVFARGLPYAGMVFGYAVAWHIVRSIPLALAVALVIGVLARISYAGLVHAAETATLLDTEDKTRSALRFQAFWIEDADGDEHPFLRINHDIELAGETPGDVVDSAVEVAEALADGEDPPATRETRRADYLRRLAIVDAAEADDKLTEQVRKHLFHALRENGQIMERDELEDELSDFPKEMWQAYMDRHWRLGNIAYKGQHVVLKHDPFA